jgi:DNA-binding transcriptional LysR family regulator
LAVNTADALIEVAKAGLSVARMMSYQAAAALREGQLVRILHAYEPKAILVHLVHTGPSPDPLKLRVFLDFAVPS